MNDTQFRSWLEAELLKPEAWSGGRGLDYCWERAVHIQTGNELEYFEGCPAYRSRKLSVQRARPSELTFSGMRVPFPISAEWTQIRLKAIHKHARERRLAELTVAL